MNLIKRTKRPAGARAPGNRTAGTYDWSVGDAEKVRASRDGDRFHYYWAARRALLLLDPSGDLEVVGVEGLPAGEEVSGEEVIDVAEYYGGHNAETCTRFRYAQLKHSTLRTAEPVVASELKKTLEKFAGIYRSELADGRDKKLEFVVVANRKLNHKVRLSLREIGDGFTDFTHPSEAKYLRGCMGFNEDNAQESAFCQLLAIEDGVPGVADMERLLRQELEQFLPGGGTGTEMPQLMETVSRCATSLADRQTLGIGDILVSLRTTQEELFPAPSAIEQLSHVIHTQDVDDIAAELQNGPNNKLLITAVGGVGKSVLASALESALPERSVTMVYDCFAGGDYRKVTSQRHEHRIGLTQIANQLAAAGMCTPLIPTQAPEASYVRVFMRRIHAAANQLALENPNALLTVVIDAADNAAMAAAEQQSRTFVADLFWEKWPENARLVQLCRPERKHLLRIPLAGVTELPLAGFQKTETLHHLQIKFPGASIKEASELHVLSDGNPRVQAMAMESAETVADALAALQIASNRPGEVLDTLLAQQVQSVADSGHLLPNELTPLCEALATLYPPMPLDILAEITGVDANAIRSFAVALGRGLHTSGTTLQFRDEPTETWFRSAHGLNTNQKREFARKVEPFADSSPYVASVLPQLFFEAEMQDDLVELALSNKGLPGEIDELKAQEIARSRARFALCAMLRESRNADAALLAVRAGDMSSGHSRKMKLIRSHTDLAARFLEADIVEALCSGRELASYWPGSNLHVEAALLSHIDEFKDAARSRLRSAMNNFSAILRLPATDTARRDSDITANEIADLAMVAVNLDGAEGGFDFMSRWRPKEFVRTVATKLCARLGDAGRYEDLTGLIVHGKNHKHVQASAAETMFEFNVVPSDEATLALTQMLGKRKKPFSTTRRAVSDEPDVRGVVWTLVHALRTGMVDETEALRILNIHLPVHLPDFAGSRGHTPLSSSLLLGFALRARLTGTTLAVETIASEKLMKLMEEKEHANDQHARDFNANIPGLLPWAECWLAALLEGDSPETAASFKELVTALKPVSDYNTPFVLLNAVAEIATRMLTLIPRDSLIKQFASWHKDSDQPLTRSRRAVARIALRSPVLESFGLEVLTRGIDAAQGDRTDAESRVESLMDLARTILAVNENEARAIFDAAVNEADRVGDDLYERWQSLTNTAKSLGTGTESIRTYRLFQIGEELDRSGEFHVTELAERLRLMHEPTYVSAISRARDRRTLDFSLMLTPAFLGASDRGLERLDLLALYAFKPRSDWGKPLSNLSPASAALATSVFEAFTRFERAHGEVPEPAHDGPRSFDYPAKDPPIDLAIEFGDDDFTTEDSWNKALDVLGWRTGKRRELAELAMVKHPTRRPEVLDALGSATNASTTDFANLAHAAAQQPQTLALRSATARFLQSFVTRFARRICTRFDDVDLVAFAEATGTTVTKVTQLAAKELGSSAHDLTYREYFLLASHLATTLDTEPTGKVFDALASLFEDLAPSDTSADGPYDSLPSHPENSSSCIAGLIWCALGDMSTELRWQAAHAVLLLVRLGCEDELKKLALFADGTEPVAPFIDSRLPFYSLHARMWLLLALARAAHEPNASTLLPFVPWLADVVRGPHHAANQVLAQRTLLELSRRGIAPEAASAGVLTVRVVAEWIEMEYNERRGRPNPLTVNGKVEGELERDRFFFDFESYWCRDLADTFGSTAEDVGRRAAHVAANLEGHKVFANSKDPRSDADVYDQQKSYPDRGVWPGQDNLAFYLAVHSLLSVGAELAESATAYKEPDSSDDSYSGWLSTFLPKRSDGRWLADRRDSPPVPAPDAVVAAQVSKDDWPWTLSKETFAGAAGIGSDWVTVWANIDSASGELSEETLVECALVPHDTARSLLIAVQTSPLGPYSFRMPTANDHFDRPDKYPFSLVPWLDVNEYHHGIDERDERGGGVRFPPTRPSESIIAQFDLTPDEDQRTWFHDGAPVFRSRVWNNMSPGVGGRESGTGGEQFEIHHEFLKRVLQEMDLTLILQVGLRRARHRSYYQRRNETNNEFEWLDRSGKTYLVNPEGSWLQY